MEEIEVKVLEINRKAIEDKLKILGAEFEFELKFHALSLDNNQNDVQASHKTLRLRQEGESTVLTLKEVPGNKKKGSKVKKRIETEISVSSFDTTRTLLEKLGFKRVVREDEKIRRSWKLGDASIVFDRYLGALSHIPEFMEIEAPNEARIMEVATILEIGKSKLKDFSTRHLIKKYAYLAKR
ncbi:class IV adenylate cyclase [bacterium]|nr:class IV adenylate cyclase [bacterium]